MDNYSEKFLMKIGVLICTVFMALIIFFVSGIKIDYDFFKNKSKDNQGNMKQKNQIDNTFLSSTINFSSLGCVNINLPGGVSEENVSVRKSIIDKKIKIAFPKGVGEYDLQNITNDTQVISNVDLNVTDVMVTIDLTLGDYRDCEVEYKNGQMQLDFFNPAEVDIPIVVIDAGHGGDDVGAIAGGIYEKDIDLQVCEKIKEYFSNDNILVYFTRQDDSYPSVEARVDFSNAIMPDLFISVHSNWYDYDDVSGTMVLYNVKDTSQFGSQWLSEIMCDEVAKVSGTVNKGAVDGNDIHIVRHSMVPVALVEMGFMSNQQDLEKLTSERGQQQFAQGIYNGIIRALTELGKY